MRRMYSENQIKKIIEESPAAVLEALKGQALSVGKINADNAEIFENISDSKGHLRFIEGNISLRPALTTLTQTYGKWSLSGSHLMIVLCFDIPDATVLTNTSIATIEVPEWVKNKIVPVVQTVISRQVFDAYNEDYTYQTFALFLEKSATNNIVINTSGDFTTTKDRSIRIQFDLLIDNDSE